MASEWEDFDTWEPSYDYPGAPPAKSAKISQPPRRRPAPPPAPEPAENESSLNAASFFQEFSAAAEEAGRHETEQHDELPYIDTPGIAALLANAENLLGGDGPEPQDSLYSNFRDEFVEQPEAMRGGYGGAAEATLRDSTSRDANMRQRRAAESHNAVAGAVTSTETVRVETTAKPQYSPGWQSLVDGWDEAPAHSGYRDGDMQSPHSTTPVPGDQPASEAMRKALGEGPEQSQTSWIPLRSETQNPPVRPAPGTQRTVAGTNTGTEVVGAVAEATVDGLGTRQETRLVGVKKNADGSTTVVRRVGTPDANISPVIQRDGISVVVALAGGILLSLIGIGLGVGVGMNFAPQPSATATVTVTETPQDPSSPDSISNASPSPTASDPEDATAASSLNGLKVALDAGHNGGNAAAWQQIGQNVPDGRGGQKSCDTTGTATDDGFPEHEFNWKVVNLVKARLEEAGATVFLTRDTDNGVGPCVDQRGTFGQKVGADVMVSIHGNGTTDTSVHGFFAMIADPPLNASQGEPSQKLAQHLIAGLSAAGFTPQSTGPITNGLWKRADLAGLNLQEVPDVMLELGEMRNPADAATMKSDAGQEKYAAAILAGLKSWAEENRPAVLADSAAVSPEAATSSETPAAH